MTRAVPNDSLQVPARLRRRVDALLTEHGLRAPADGHDTLRAAVDITRTLLAQPDTGRETAIDLLAVDALVAGAIESLAEEPGRVGGLCEEAMQLLASIPARP